MSKYSYIREGETLGGALISRVSYITDVNLKAKPESKQVSFKCISCGKIETTRVDTFKRKINKNCAKCNQLEAGSKRVRCKNFDKRTYNVWSNLVRRCNDPNNNRYSEYGDRGISVCERWAEPPPHGYNNFTEDMGLAPVGLTLDRIDNDGNYELNNCRWVDYYVQANNRSNNRHLTYNGETMTLTQWARHAGIKTATLEKRLSLGWSVEDAIEKPLRGKKQ